MTQMRILARNLHDTAVLSAPDQAMPVNYTQRSERSFVWRSADLQPKTITAALSGVHHVDCVALARHNLGALGFLRVELMLGGQVVKDSGVISLAMLIPAGVWRAGIDPWGATYNDQMPAGSELGIYWLGEPIAVDGYRLTLSGSTSDGYFEVGRVFTGLSFSPSVNMSWGRILSWVESGEHVKTEGGTLRTVGQGGLRRRVRLRLDWLTASDREVLITNLIHAGLGADLLISLYPDDKGFDGLIHTMVCRRENALEDVHERSGNWKAELACLEV